jgi:hypothetical protein
VKRTAWIALTLTVGVGAAMLTVLWHVVTRSIPSLPPSERLEYYKLCAKVFEAILVGFVAALIGILIPAIFAEARASFERLRDSRVAYSEAKTAGDYIAIRLSTLDLKGAAALLQRAHISKHLAELYPELGRHLKRRGINKTPAQWGDRLYSQYFDIREVLEDNAHAWDAMSPPERLDLIRYVVPSPKKERLVPGTLDDTSPELWGRRLLRLFRRPGSNGHGTLGSPEAKVGGGKTEQAPVRGGPSRSDPPA